MSYYLIKELDINLVYPWGMTWIDDSSMLITQKNGQLFLVNTEDETQIEVEHEIPSIQAGQGGLLDITSENDTVWITCSITKNNKYTTAVYRAKLEKNRLTNLELIFEALPYLNSTIHFGSRIEIKGDYIFVTIGERGGGMIAQDTSNVIGSIIRINKDGSIPKDNPYINNKEWIPQLYQIGVRNPQGISLDPVTGDIFISNHGPKGGDFIGPVVKGSNYGWKQVAWGGVNYSGTVVGDGNIWEPGFLKPDYIWVPSIGIGGIKFYSGKSFPKWNNHLLVASLKFKYLSVLFRDGGDFIKEEIVFKDKIGRIRDIEVNQDGEIFLIADEKDSKLYRLLP
ncbi:PQQ-dependent sugar dehydrogenase [Thiospirochaeta perfilievii]|uniref:PQQ-dependent sugar dehydrogenase n=1 Tax=Thiospirochaeta perfilievii TaxID=252967 RepID=A0A5C1QCY0_9SPIO|nr:PQQ-dependent sugar dehydrogenase [Thiospirochaeta perfilievii]QEN04486.1 PQQ-dependent sugar dehydrogenase [Thiospirochaeta perfilievii]